MTIKQLTSALAIITVIASCSSNEIGNSKDVNPETIYQRYSIKYEHGNDKVELYAQFRFGGVNGTTLVLNSPAALSFDGEDIKVDSSKYSGAFYQMYKPSASFAGKHHFVFTDINNKKYGNEFSFSPINLDNPPAVYNKTSPLEIKFDAAGTLDGDQVEIHSFDTDSSFSVVKTLSAADRTVQIPVEDLKKQKGKSFSLDIAVTRDIPLQQNTKEGGKMELSYRMKPLTVKESKN